MPRKRDKDGKLLQNGVEPKDQWMRVTQSEKELILKLRKEKV